MDRYPKKKIISTRKVEISSNNYQNFGYKIISFKLEYNKGSANTLFVNSNKINRKSIGYIFKDYNPKSDFYIIDIKATNKQKKDTISLNDIHLELNKNPQKQNNINYNYNIFPNFKERKIDFSILNNLVEIPTNSSDFEIMSYTFSYTQNSERQVLKINSNKITPEIKNELTKIRSYSRINFENIIIKDTLGILYQIPIKQFVLMK